MKNSKYKYGDTFLSALFNRIVIIHYRLKNEIFYGPLWVVYWLICLSLGLQLFLTPFSGTEKVLVSHYLVQRYLYRTKYSYLELLEYKNDGILDEKLKSLLFSKRR